MSHTLFQAVKITPTPITKPSPLKPLLPSPHSSFFRPLPATQFNLRKDLAVKASSSIVDGGDSIGVLERCFSAAPACSSSSTVTYGPVMKGGKYGAFGGAATLEKSKLDMSQKQSKSAPEASTDGGNNNNDNINNLGGGSGGDDNGDDDSYFDNSDDGEDGDEGGLFRRRIILQELFDGKFIDTVLNEWQKTMMDLPAGLRQAVQMGLVSSAQIVNYLETNARPTATRIISRMLPQGLLRAFNGRIISDPAFLHRLLLEQTSTIGCSVWWELKNRMERIKQEWDLALINVLTLTACNAMVVWSLAPCRPYGNTFRSDLQNRLQKLPNNIFENSYRLREFDLLQRVHSFFFKAAELSMVGLTAGAVQGALSNLSASKKDGRLSVTIPTVSNNALGYGAFLGINANLRYQLLCGFDKAMVNHFDVIGVALFFSTAMRLLNAQLGETSRLAWLGVESDPLAQSENLLKAYSRPIEEVDQPSSSKWFMSKNSIISSGLELLGFKQGQNKTAPGAEVPPPPKAQRKRVVRKKVATSRA